MRLSVGRGRGYHTFTKGGALMERSAWSPSRDLSDPSDRLNHVFAQGNENEAMIVADWIPLVDISETPAEYVIKVEIPEVKKDDVKVSLEHGVLTVQGLRRQETEEKGKTYHRVERSFGSFIRSFSLPDLLDDEKVKADFKDGILMLHLPKSDKAKTKAIEVKVA